MFSEFARITLTINAIADPITIKPIDIAIISSINVKPRLENRRIMGTPQILK